MSEIPVASLPQAFPIAPTRKPFLVRLARVRLRWKHLWWTVSLLAAVSLAVLLVVWLVGELLPSNEKYLIQWASQPYPERQSGRSALQVFRPSHAAYSRGRPRKWGNSVTYQDWDTGRWEMVEGFEFMIDKVEPPARR